VVRNISIGNGRLLVVLDDDYRIADFYYSGCQGENHVMGHPFRFGTSVNGRFQWIGKPLIKSIDYLDNTMVGKCRYEFEGFNLTSTDFVDIYEDVYVKHLVVENKNPLQSDINLFFHQDFYIYGNNIGDTAQYFPDLNSIIHYKKKRYFLVSSLDSKNNRFDQYAMGVKDFNGMEGVWKDAEDGKLSMSPVAIGSVDSILRHHMFLNPGEKVDLFYYIYAGKDLDSVKKGLKNLHMEQLKRLETRTSNYWHLWVTKESPALPENWDRIYKRSLIIVRSHLADSGGIMASGDSENLKFNRDGYYYVWPRDAAVAAFSLIRANHAGTVRPFFEFTRSAVTKDGYFLHKYDPDGTPSSSWLPRVHDGKSVIPLQEDETSLVLWALWSHFKKVRDIDFISDFYEDLIRRSADFILKFRDSDGLPKSSYDVWEERFGVHTFTIATCYAALRASSNFARTFGDDFYAKEYDDAAATMRDVFDKQFYSEEKKIYARGLIDGNLDYTPDSAITSVYLLGMKPASDERVLRSMHTLMENLQVKGNGGIARYVNDPYHNSHRNTGLPGNPWIITTLWAAQYYMRVGNFDMADDLINWCVSHSLESGVLPEQIDSITGKPVSVSPLVWSHAQFVIAMHDYIDMNHKVQK
jgi:GH15 family glucan-1,4-alpha-glucosidase